MSFELCARETFAATVQRVARECLDQVQAVLSGGEAGARPAPDAIHLARKELKKLRALLRLAHAALGEAVFRRENLCCRDTGRALSSVRDAAVLVQAFDALRPQLYGLVAPETIASVHDRLQAAADASEARLDLPEVIAEMRAARARVQEWPWIESEDRWRIPAGGLRRVYRQGRQAMRRAATEVATESDFHDWRKCVKLLAAQLRLLGPLNPADLRSTAKHLDQLAECLGEEHDLAVLGVHLFGGAEGHLESTAELEAIRRLLDARRNVLQRRALKYGWRLYRKKASHFVARLKPHWQHWRKQAGHNAPVAEPRA